MTTKMKRALRAAVYRIFYESLALIDAEYPRRAYVMDEHISHMTCCRELACWFAQVMAAIDELDVVEEPKHTRNRAFMLGQTDEDDAEWGFFEDLFLPLLPGLLLGIGCLPAVAVTFITTMNRAIAIARDDANECMAELSLLADQLGEGKSPKSMGMGTKLKLTPKPMDRDAIEKSSQELADRVKKLFGGPLKPAPKNSLRP